MDMTLDTIISATEGTLTIAALDEFPEGSSNLKINLNGQAGMFSIPVTQEEGDLVFDVEATTFPVGGNYYYNFSYKVSGKSFSTITRGMHIPVTAPDESLTNAIVNGNLTLSSLPDSDPEISGRVYQIASVLMVSP